MDRAIKQTTYYTVLHQNGMPLEVDVIAQSDTKCRRHMLATKRLMDTLIILLATPIWVPVMSLIALLIKLDSPGPVFFRQKRTGLAGDVFSIYKFRTMHHEACATDSGRQSQKSDDRHTRMGKWLRRSSLDELPQLLNILRGEMSLIGPRPHARYHDQLFMEHAQGYGKRFRVRPGLTGLAQVRGERGLLETQEQLQARTDYDNEYIERWNPMLDVWVLFKTVWVVIKATNAH